MKTMGSKRLRQNILGAVGEAAQRTPLPGQMLVMPKRKIEVGSFYEIDHSNLPSIALAVLRSVRVVMVTAKTELNVTVRFPSTQSLQAYFDLDYGALRSRLYPALDEKFVIGPELAAEVIGREIPSEEFGEHKHTKSFWLMDYFSIEEIPSLVSVCDTAVDSKAKNGPLLLDLQNHELKGWGSQRLVAYLREPIAQHEEMSVHASQEEDERAVKNEEETDVIKDQKIIPYTRKRKKHSTPTATHTKKIKHSPKSELVEVKPKIKANKNKEYIERWPTKRYEAAAKELCEVLKAKRAVYGNPISRFDLRAQARYRIGDTGLLDHLLKHLAGKEIPGGDQRLRRRCDAEGKMEYWLESADLAQIRKEAGIQDPYWTPPPGWKPGDCIGPQGCLCGEELRQLKEELSSMKRQIQVLKSKDEDERAIALVQPDSSASSGRLNIGTLKLASSKKEMYEALLKKKSLMEEQLLEVSKALLELEELAQEIPKSSSDEEMNELSTTCKEDFPEAAAGGEVSESDGAEGEGEEEAETRLKLRLSLRKLKPCENQDNFSNLPSQTEAVDNLVQNLMVLTGVSTSPNSTTTSLTTH